MKKLKLEQMAKFQGGQITDCEEFMDVIDWLDDNGHPVQSDIIWNRFYDQYCGHDSE